MHVTQQEVQQWLETTKMDITSIDVELEATAFEVVASSLQGHYTTTTWVNQSTTPKLVRVIMSMLIAGYSYNRQFTEDVAEAGAYGNWLISYAMSLLLGISTGGVDLVGLDSERDASSYPTFWPTDQATDLADPELGGSVDATGGAPRSFSMGQVF